MCAFAAHLTKISPGIIVTFLTTFGFLQRAKAELSRSFEPGEEAYAQRVRCGPNLTLAPLAHDRIPF